MPVELVHRVVRRESSYNPKAYNSGNFGLMQIRYNTARGLGYDGAPAGLFDAETNLKYAVKYLRGAWLVADSDHDGAVALYSTGYYYDAKRKGMLHLLRN
ncbi:Transglycosylase SLT domain protein [compost metagenome]